MEVILLQKRIKHKPDQWEDLVLPAPGNRDLHSIAYRFRELKQGGTYRAVVRAGSPSSLTTLIPFQVYRKGVYEVEIDGVVQS